MILVLLYYITVLVFTTIFGVYILSFLKYNNVNIFFALITGILSVNVLSVFYFICGPVNISALLSYLALLFFFIWLNPQVYKSAMQLLIQNAKQLKGYQLFYVVAVVIFITYQSAQESKIHDDGMYYQQSILWAQQHGLVKGVANLHPAMGLFSSWHIFTAFFDTAQIGLPAFHHYNGLILIAAICYFLIELNINPGYKNYAYTMLFLLPLLGFMFLTAPNTDLPLILINVLLFYMVFLKKQTGFVFLIWGVAAFFIKPPAILAVLTAAYIVVVGAKTNKKYITYIGFILIMALVLFYKNYVLSGYLLYPSAFPDVVKATWKVPKEVNTFYRVGIKSWGISDSFKINEIRKTADLSVLLKFKGWFLRPGYKGLFNKIILMLLVTGAIYILRLFYLKSISKYFLFVMCFLIIVIIADWFLLTQYRLMLPAFSVMFGLLVYLQKLFNLNNTILVVTVFVLMFVTLVPFEFLQNSSRNKSITSFNGFNTKYLVKPFSQFYLGQHDFILNNGNVLNYYDGLWYCWQCPLPCQSQGQRNMLFKYFGYKTVYLDSADYTKGFKMVK